MDKRLIVPQNLGDRRDVFFVREDRTFLKKHASSYHPEIASYIEKAQPLPGLIQILLTALGAYEFWGQNVNGDRFKVPALTHEGSDYGYKTFESNTNYFTHHVNSNPALAKGKILKAVWNEQAKRVELVVGIDLNLDPEGAAAIDRGEDLTFSMGAKLPFDVCTECGNRAKTRAEYCDHLRYLMNQINPMSGKLVGADNLFPKFFDLSRVLIPADKTAHMWTKVASALNPYRLLGSAQLAELPLGKLSDTAYLMGKVAEQREFYAEKLARAKSASVSKNATITKRIEIKATPEPTEFEKKLEKSVPVSKALLHATSPALPADALKKLEGLEVPLLQFLSTLAALGMEPKEEELGATSNLGRMTSKEVQSLTLGPEHFHSGVASLFLPLVPERSYARPVLVRRIVILAKKLEDGDGGITKKAETIRELANRSEPQGHSLHPGYVAGLLAALYALFGPHATGMSKGIGRLLADYPLVALPLGAGLLAGYNTLTQPAKSGFYSVDANLDGLYNKSWQSRFAEQQARPTTVIKTGADTELAKKVFYGVPAVYLGSKIMQAREDLHPEKKRGPISHFIAQNPELVSAGLIGEHLSGRPISQRISKALESGKRVIKEASLQNLEFLEAVPAEEREVIWDLAILDAADRISKKVLGG